MAPLDTARSLTIRRPDDWHLHLRDGAMLAAVVADTARHFGRAMVMPNLMPPVGVINYLKKNILLCKIIGM